MLGGCPDGSWKCNGGFPGRPGSAAGVSTRVVGFKTAATEFGIRNLDKGRCHQNYEKRDRGGCHPAAEGISINLDSDKSRSPCQRGAIPINLNSDRSSFAL
jgi:hypothetical protein